MLYLAIHFEMETPPTSATYNIIYVCTQTHSRIRFFRYQYLGLLNYHVDDVTHIVDDVMILLYWDTKRRPVAYRTDYRTTCVPVLVASVHKRPLHSFPLLL